MTGPWRIEHHETLASTSDYCADRARQGEPDRLMVTATQQIAGRGRAGRVWSSPPGNFYASVLLRPNSPAQQGGLFALTAGLSLLEAIEESKQRFFEKKRAKNFSNLVRGALSLKWPNDIMAGPAKLAGILLDATIESSQITTLIIGFGVNLTFAPTIPGRTTTCLATLGQTIEPHHLAQHLTTRLDHWLNTDAQTLRTAWQAHAHPPGTSLTIDSGRITGIYEGIDPDGSLRLRQEHHITIIRSGDVAVL